ncbi:MAG: hypothetical protein A3B74_01390 [Candidatus Kerfeldbacteria bacterium RIFCSPHIGHO2_02_FULL_42_14]|uniref:Uncharacterized protein n=1 Tax=Candidatus Kerfeldbacteria bacterium RIFCSPHIGHO2_02_FULL_42_14 TaxID=1798540 RepID=A0A1G2AQD9_9BACT|nr:MAG: hypothetical protein A3B74_01390 [Candidatus Kerfeldbacteria bacterium RIFCSPHIGHO2_02_FULL_42_14]OGY81213.1 MAG: hypothetical protein A3E60_02905 [Candidatus Kerfeldbacteria bacterium RIFCSPHIGHO2_12_FULL_42_13]OGY83367.1 MAG: hypothetical protein A3I91_01805 [Candidatus Kerfeldbacteria bacterium RIFCSPLOWO2_02_FULL_42_19]OGY86371.1 MAG: hypothetical protein A3G01_05235 [Candidatus Kerfeldbacteria bacterium RIFCSPLOWO2_12_FULL_43_9]
MLLSQKLVQYKLFTETRIQTIVSAAKKVKRKNGCNACDNNDTISINVSGLRTISHKNYKAILFRLKKTSRISLITIYFTPMPRLEKIPSRSIPFPQEQEDESPETDIMTPADFLKEYIEDPETAVQHAFDYMQNKFEHTPHGKHLGMTEYFNAQKSDKDTLIGDLIEMMPDEETPLTTAFTNFMHDRPLLDREEQLIKEHIENFFNANRKKTLH